jgi:Protein of unknown function (DUF4446)
MNVTVTQAIAAVLLGIVLLWVGWLHRQLSVARTQIQALTPPGMAKLEAQLQNTSGNTRDALTRIDELWRRCDNLHDQLQTCLQHVGVVRFSPFRDTGGDQSFAIALLDHHANGIVVSSLHNRTDTRVFAKPVQQGQSSFTLSHEEQEAISIAIRHGDTGEHRQRARELRGSRM